MTHHRADTQKPDHHVHGFREMCGIIALDIIDGDLPEELPRNVQVENGRYSLKHHIDCKQVSQICV